MTLVSTTIVAFILHDDSIYAIAVNQGLMRGNLTHQSGALIGLPLWRAGYPLHEDD
jgi:hypothetical protein